MAQIRGDGRGGFNFAAVLGLVMCFMLFLPVFNFIVGFLLSVMGFVRARKWPKGVGGACKGIAVVGMVLNGLGVLSIIFAIVWMVSML